MITFNTFTGWQNIFSIQSQGTLGALILWITAILALYITNLIRYRWTTPITNRLYITSYMFRYPTRRWYQIFIQTLYALAFRITSFTILFFTFYTILAFSIIIITLYTITVGSYFHWSSNTHITRITLIIIIWITG